MTNPISASKELKLVQDKLPALLQELRDAEERVLEADLAMKNAEANVVSTMTSIEQTEIDANIENRPVDPVWYKKARYALSRYRESRIQAAAAKKEAEHQVKRLNQQIRDLRRSQSILLHLKAYNEVVLKHLDASSVRDDELEEIESVMDQWIRANVANAEGLGLKELGLTGDDD